LIVPKSASGSGPWEEDGASVMTSAEELAKLPVSFSVWVQPWVLSVSVSV
jgi:hypothetical protein